MSGRLARHARRFGSGRGGNVAILVALGSAVLMGAGAVGIDLGLVFQARRKAQGAADIAAMLAAVDPTQADTVARRSLGDNGYGTATATVVPGSYDASTPGTAPTSRFNAGGTPPNAVRVGLSTSVPTTFAKVIGLPAAVPLRVTGTAASAQFAAFSIGSGLASVSGGVANALLGAMLGTTVSLSVADYNALAGAKVDGLRVLDALATSLNLQAASYSDILQANASVGQVLMAMRVAAQGNNAAVSALSGLLNALPNAGNVVPLGQLEALGDAAALAPPRGFTGPALSVMDLVSATAILANGQNQVSVDLGATIPGLLGTRLTLAIGERKRSSGWVRPDSPNATVQTAQTRLLIEATITAPLGLGAINLPIYVEAAPAQATLKSLKCSGAAGRQVTLDAQTGVATLAIAQIARSAINTGSASPDLSQPATLIKVLTVPLVTGRAQLTLGSTRQTLVFSDAEIANHTVKTITSGNMTQSLTGSLLNNLNVTVLGLNPLLPGALAATLGAVAPALDIVLDTTLRSLGIHLGYADIDVDGVLCSQAVLVQ